MKLLPILLAAACTLDLSSAHYTFNGLVVNGQKVGRDWQYVRQHTRGYMPTFKEEILDKDFRCNLGALSGANTDVYPVKPGDKVALKKAFGDDPMLHPGPAQVYLSRADGSVKNYDGSGDWFKVHQSILCKPGIVPRDLQYDGWCMYGENVIEFQMPDVPAGEYLVRAEHIALHGAHDGKAEFYYACGQVSVSGGTATSIPGPSVKIPGVYQPTDKAINFSVWGRSTTYPTLPGPDVVPGGTIRGSIDGSSSAIVAVKGANPSPPVSSASAAPIPSTTVALPATSTRLASSSTSSLVIPSSSSIQTFSTTTLSSAAPPSLGPTTFLTLPSPTTSESGSMCSPVVSTEPGVPSSSTPEETPATESFVFLCEEFEGAESGSKKSFLCEKASA